ncbi:MAG TPA: hypothetical protein ENN99_07295, partial [Chloroflexi bacterium]|nr:hypothetical protein [Chloroflexota bacterium]
MSEPSPPSLWSVELDALPVAAPLAVDDLLLVPTGVPAVSPQHAVLHALDLADGALRWRKRFEHGLVSGLARIAGGLTLVGLTSLHLTHGTGRLVGLDEAGEVHFCWAPEADLAVQRVSGPAVAGDLACLTADARTFVVLDLRTGAERVRVDLGAEAKAPLSAPAVADGVAYVPCKGPHLFAVGLDGQVRWRFAAEGDPDVWMEKTPLVVEGRVFAVLTSGALLVLRAEDGSPVGRVG